MATVAEPTPELIREELAKILISPPFARGEKLCRFLRFVVEETLAGRAETLKEYNVGVTVYERRPDYDTRSDSTVRVEAGRLRTKLIEYYAGPGAACPIRIELPKAATCRDSWTWVHPPRTRPEKRGNIPGRQWRPRSP